MTVIVLRKKKLYIILFIVLLAIIGFGIHKYKEKQPNLLMGGNYNIYECEYNESETINQDNEVDSEKYFRPSKLPILNNRPFDFNNTYNKNIEEIKLPDKMLKTPEDTIINYFSILREAANPTDKEYAGCGTLGEAKIPYPVAYNFLDKSYQDRLPYKKYLKSFENILHTNLIKVKQVPTDENHPKDLKYFVEIETIEGSKSGQGYFGYYYGYIYLSENNGQYKISDIEYYGENYLCAPYHGWAYDAELSVDIRYGDWCNLIKERHPTEQEGYEKRVMFTGTDGNEYMILFFELTNGTDREIAQYKKDENGNWKLIKLDPTKCIKKD